MSAQMQDAQRTEEAMALREMIVEATRALARLDAAGLEELAASCRLLDLHVEHGAQRLGVAEALRGKEEIRVLGRLVAMTGENLRVLRSRSRDRWGGTDYCQHLAPAWMQQEERCGDD